MSQLKFFSASQVICKLKFLYTGHICVTGLPTAHSTRQCSCWPSHWRSVLGLSSNWIQNSSPPWESWHRSDSITGMCQLFGFLSLHYRRNDDSHMEKEETCLMGLFQSTIIIIIIIIAFKGAIRDFLQSPHSATNCLQYARLSGPGAVVYKSRATHRMLITCKCHVTCHLVRRDSSAINSFNPVPDKLSGATRLPSAPTPDKLSGVLATFVLASFCFNGIHI